MVKKKTCLNGDSQILLERLDSFSKMNDQAHQHIIEKIDNIVNHFKEQANRFDEVDKKLTGDTEKNTKFRVSQTTVNKLVGASITILVTGVIALIIKVIA